MKKIRNLIIFFLITLISSFSFANAKEMKLSYLESELELTNPNANFAYIIGSYVFTSDYNIDTRDIMFASNSINISAEDKAQGNTARSKMAIHKIEKVLSDDFLSYTWVVKEDYVKGNTSLTNDTELNIEYIDYEKVKNMFTVTFNSDNSTDNKIVHVLEGNKIEEPENPSKEGYIFEGWYKCSDDECTELDNNKFDFTNIDISKNITLKAKWSEIINVKDEINNFIDEIITPDSIAKDYLEMKISEELEDTLIIDIVNPSADINSIRRTGIAAKLESIMKSGKYEKITVNNVEIPANTNAPEIRNKIIEALSNELMKVSLKSSLPTVPLEKLINKEIKVVFTLSKDYVNSENETHEIIYTVKFIADKIIVNDEESLSKALSSNYDSIVIGTDFDIISQKEINNNVIIDGNNKVLTVKSDNIDYAFIINSDVTINNLSLKDSKTAIKVNSNGNLTTDSLTIDNSSVSGIEVEGTLNATNLVNNHENYYRPTIKAKDGSNVIASGKNNQNTIVLNEVYDVTKDIDGPIDTKTKIEGYKYHYLDENNSKLFTITFNKGRYKALTRYCIYNEIPISPKGAYMDIMVISNSNIYVQLFQHKWTDGEKEYADVIKEEGKSGLPKATKDATYTAIFGSPELKPGLVFADTKEEITDALSKDDTKIIYVTTKNKDNLENIENIEIKTLDVGDLKIDKGIELVGDGTITLEGTIEIAADNVVLEDLTIKGKKGNANLNNTSSNKNGSFYVIKVDDFETSDGTKSFEIWDSKISNGDSNNQAYSALYIPVDNIKATIYGNTFVTDNIYNTIEFGYGKSVASKTYILENYFEGKNKNNHINIYTVQDNAEISISRNKFEYSGNAIRLSNTSNATATFTVSSNRYKDTIENNDYKGFILLQATNHLENFNNYTINISYLYHGLIYNDENTKKLTTQGTGDERVYYYSDSTGSHVGTDYQSGTSSDASKNVKINIS